MKNNAGIKSELCRLLRATDGVMELTIKEAEGRTDGDFLSHD